MHEVQFMLRLAQQFMAKPIHDNEVINSLSRIKKPQAMLAEFFYSTSEISIVLTCFVCTHSVLFLSITPRIVIGIQVSE